MKDPTRHVYSRDLDVVLEENNMHQGKSYLDQVLEPNPLGFLRNGKTYGNDNTSNSSNHDNFTSASSTAAANNNHTTLPTRRARAGTMPSMMSFDSLHSQPALLRTATHNYAALNHNNLTTTTTVAAPTTTLAASTSTSLLPPPQHHQQQHRPPLATPVGGGRHRSGSLNLPPPKLSFDTSSSLFWSSNSATPTPPSPATEQLLQGDSDFSIARTMRSLGLEDTSAGNGTTHNNTTTITNDTSISTTTQLPTSTTNCSNTTVMIDEEEELINQSRASLLASASNTTTRNRSYSVNATVRYDPPPPPMNPAIGNPPFTLRGRGNTVSKSSFGGTPPPSLHQHHHHLGPYHHHHNHLLDSFNSPSSSPPLPPPSQQQQQQQQQQRTRSISFGQSSSPPSFHGLTRPTLIHGTHGDSTSSSTSSTSSLWQMHLPLTPAIGEEEHMSLGDSELLANMYDPTSQPTQPDAYKKNQEEGLFIEPYMHLSHSTPTSLRPNTNNNLRSSPPITATTSSTVGSRSLWIGNIDSSITADVLTHTFAPYGPIESVRLLMEKECAFVNYFYQEHAVRAKEDVLGPLAGRVGQCIVRIGYGRADAVSTSVDPPPPVVPVTLSSSPPSPPPTSTMTTTTSSLISNPPTVAAQQDQVTHQATRALWLGNIPSGTSPSILEKAFDKYGTIESIRILSHKTCAFINFDCIGSASDAQEAFLQQQIDLVGFENARIGFAKVPPPPQSLTASPLTITATTTSASNKSDQKKQQQPSPDLSSSSSSSTTSATRRSPKLSSTQYETTPMNNNGNSNGPKSHQDTLDELWHLMTALGCSSKDKVLLQELETPSQYATAIPHVPDFGPNRQIDANRLRDIRKKLDATTNTSVCDTYAKECLPEIAELCSDYIGNTVLQRFFEKCSEQMKLTMLERIAPHLAAIGIHKNGTWAAQKILDTIKTPKQCALVRKHVKTYVPALLLDQFGNYVVQCCLALGEFENQFVFDAMVENCETISQGRFGARAMRGILENQHTTKRQHVMMAASLLQHTQTMVTHPNGSLLVAWLMETYGGDGSGSGSSNSKSEAAAAATVWRTLAHTWTTSSPRSSLATIATHKLGGPLVLKLLHQIIDKEAQDTILSALVTDTTLHALLLENNNNNNRGIQFYQKVIHSPHLSQAEQHVLCARALSILVDEEQRGSALNANAQSFLDELNVMVKG